MGSPTPRRAAPFFEIASQAPTSAEGEQQLHIRRPTANPRRCAERPRLGPQRKASYVPITHNGEKRATLQYHTTAKSELRSNITQRRKGYAPISAEGEPQLHMTAEGRPSPVRGAPEQKASYAPKTTPRQKASYVPMRPTLQQHTSGDATSSKSCCELRHQRKDSNSSICHPKSTPRRCVEHKASTACRRIGARTRTTIVARARTRPHIDPETPR